MEGATHFRFVCSIGAVSNFQYDSTSKEYYPIDSINNELGETVYSDYNPVNIDTAAPITLTATLAGAPVLGADISVLLCIGVEFFQQIDLVQYILSSNNAMMVDKVV